MHHYDGDTLSWDGPIRKELDLVEADIRKSVHSDQDLLTEICMHVIGAGGKRMRPGMALLAYKAVGGQEAPNIIGIAAAFELIHSATLIHDDINDDGEIRRGKVAAYKKFGVQKALIAGDFLFVRSFRLGGFWNQKVVEIISDACTATAESEILQNAWEFDPDTPLDQYLKIIEGKTAMPIWAAARVGAFLGGGSEEQIEAMGHFGLNLGMAFQIVDDTLDINGDVKDLGKSRGVDFMDGKPTLPLMVAMKDARVGPDLKRLFVKREKSRSEVDQALAMVMQTRALQESLEHAQDFGQKALAYLSSLDASQFKESMRELVEAVLDRRK
jgi:octaprenyl-diphosphate synthase